MSSSTHFSPKPEEADRGARTSRPTEGTRISLVLTMDKDKRPLHLVRSTGPRGMAQKEGHQAAWHCGRGVAFGESHPPHSFIWPVGTAIIPVPKTGAERITWENQESAERGRWRCSHGRRGDTAAEMPALGIPGRRGAGLLSVSVHLLARLLRDCAQRMLVPEDAGR